MAENKKDFLSTINPVYNAYVSNCRRKNIFWELDKKTLAHFAAQNCHYCDKPPSNNYRGCTYNGLDRIDHKKGYTKDNVQPCCKECNSLRSNRLTVEETKVAVKAINKLRKT